MIYYAAAAGLFVILKLVFSFAHNTFFGFMLAPVIVIIELFTGASCVYMPESGGWYFGALNILIDKSCSGYNFWLLCFIMISFLTLRYFERSSYKAPLILAALFFSYCITLFVNTSRILASILIQNRIGGFLPLKYSALIHEACGIATNLGFLIIIYILIEKFLTRRY